jgi:phosphatidylethanolamine/phosphatidyl-N-methylethanolamine N-methyltransferase
LDANRVERIYGRYAKVYDRTFGKVLHKPLVETMGELSLQPGDTVLEVGVGTGVSLPLYPRECKVVGIDLSAEMLAQAEKQRQRESLEHVELHRMDASRMDFADDSFDTVLAAYVITAVPDYRRVLAELIRVCKVGGRIVFLNHFRDGTPLLSAVEKAISPICRHIGFRTDLTLEALLGATPLEVAKRKKLKPFGLLHFVECVNRKDLMFSPSPS